MTLAAARARVPVLHVADADAAADQRLLLRLVEACERFTPLVASDPPDGLILDITGCAHLFGGEAAMREHISRYMQQQGLSPRIAIAGTPDAAEVMARFGTLPIVDPGGEAEALHRLPVAALKLPRETTVALTRAGLKTIGDIAARPSKILAARFGMEMTARLQRVLGKENIRLTSLRAAPDLMVEQHFAEPLLSLESLQQALARLCQDISIVLTHHGWGGRAFELGLFRSDGKLRRLPLETAEALHHAASLLRLFQLRLNTLADPLDPGFGFDAMRLSVLRSEPLVQAQGQLDGHVRDERAVSSLLDRLVIRFGRERVLRFVARDNHDPRRAAAMVPVGSSAADGIWPSLAAGEPPSRPLQLFNPPHPIDAMAEVPDGPPLQFRWRRVLHQVVSAEGPERIAPEWWHGTPQERPRDYYRIEDAQGHRFWVFREGLFSESLSSPRWFLHGIFS